MKKMVKGWVFSGAVLLSLTAFAQDDASGEENLHLADEDALDEEFALLEEEIAVDEVKSASKHRQSIFWSPSAITVFTREDIRASGATILTDLLRRVPGFDVYELKPSFPLVGARALTDDSNNLVLLLVDGREVLVELMGFALWATLAFDLEEVERVEVIRGPGSTLYGANAFAAVVSVTTVADRTAGGGDVFLSAGEVGHLRLFGRVRDSFKLGGGVLDFSAALGTERKHSPSDIRNEVMTLDYRAQAYVRYREGMQLDLSLHGGVTAGGAALFVNVADLGSTNGLSHWILGRADLGLGEVARLKIQVYHIRYSADYYSRSNLWAFGVWIADVPDFLWDSQTVDGQVQLDLSLGDDILVIGGANLRFSILDSDNLILSGSDEIRGSGFVHFRWSLLESLQLTGGMRLDLNRDTEEALSARAAAVFRPWPGQSFRLGYGLAFRKPSWYESKSHMKIEEYNQATPEIVEKMATGLGNESLVNEKVHSFEAGWRGRFFDDRLKASLDLFWNLYRHTIVFVMDVQERFGLPDIENSNIRFENEGADADAVGGEAELTLRLDEDWALWCNLGLRRVTNRDTGERMPSEPTIRVNLGARFLPDDGTFADLALHYVSAYKMALTDPSDTLGQRELFPLGDNVLVIGRVGYRMKSSEDRTMEVGLTVRAPLGEPFREYPGVSIPRFLGSDSSSDFGGEMLVRLVSLYLRGSF